MKAFDIKIAVYVLSRDREAFLQEALGSIFSAGFANEDVFISDNSTSRSVIATVVKKYPTIKYQVRGGHLDAAMHIQCVLRDFGASDYDYAFIAHDDDLFLDSACLDIKDALVKYKNAQAIAFDGFVFEDGQRKHLHGGNPDPALPALVTPAKVLSYQFDFLHQAINPFPAVLYKRTCVDKLLTVPNIGRHIDVAYLLELASMGLAVMLDPIIDYRIHPNAGRMAYSRKDLLSLYRYIKGVPDLVDGSRALTDLRWRIHFRRILENPSLLFSPTNPSTYLVFLVSGTIRYLAGVVKRWII